MGARRRIREKYGISGTGCTDCMLTMCCPLW
jgi:Cys-rich protein (TIGR01571 family)